MSNIRKRIALIRKGGVAGTPIPPAPGGAIQWAPADGGNPAGFDLVTALDLPAIAFQGDLSPSHVVRMPALAAVMGTSGRGAVSLPQLAIAGQRTARGAVSGSYTVLDALPKHDSFFDENSPATIHGSTVSLLSKTNAAIGNNRQHTYVSFDMTGVSGTVTAADVKLNISTSSALGETATYTVFSHPSQPFNESTANWTNSEPPPGTSHGTISQAVTTTPTVYTLTFTATQRANMPGRWVYLRCTGTGALGTSTITTTSKEGALKPRLTFTVNI